MSLKIGDPAPDFALEGYDPRADETRLFRRSEFAGAPLIVVFYPADNTPVCTAQLRSYTAGLSEFDQVGAAMVAISPQDVASHRGFSEAQGGFAFPMLSDLDKKVGRAYGILGLQDLYRRSTFVVDGGGEVVYAHRFVGPGLSFKPIDELVAAVTAAS
jgi:thioredoxin-dependent peroxiredoxin